ncbi:MAG TPA: formylmethanofuran dehydrogenase [Papillibacter sp.]|jgi:formylmethanofuran dehydrogenase subunit E|nr:formylmethanofuran dehydrogenase [Papillibacter sp.]
MIWDLWRKAVGFHGHECPGLAIGVRAAAVAMELGFHPAQDEEIVCVTENDACGVDGIQAILGCTMGKGNLIYRGTGKQAFSFFQRGGDKAVRLVLKQSARGMERDARIKYLLTAPAAEVFTVGKPRSGLPEKARIFQTVPCEECGEGAAENKIRLQEGKKVCLDCYQPYERGW